MFGKFNVVIGVDNECKHNHCVLIGTNLKTTEDYQLLIGNKKIQTSRVLTVAEYKEIKSSLDNLLELFKK